MWAVASAAGKRGKEVRGMSDMEKEVMEAIREVVPKLSDIGKARLLGYGEGMCAAEQPKEPQKDAAPA